MAKKTSNAMEKKIINTYLSGLSLKKTARITKVHPDTVCNILIRYDILRRPVPPRISPEKQADVIRRFISGELQKSICANVKVSPNSVRAIIDKFGIDRRPISSFQRKYKLDETVFDTVTEGSAYWTGFIMADGHIMKNNNGISVGIKESDKGHLEKLISFLKSDLPIVPRISSGPFGITRICAIVFHSARIRAALAKSGVVNKKSLNENVIGLEFNRDFWRGMIDGDGCIRRDSSKYKKPALCLCGSKQIVSQFRDFVKYHCPPIRANLLPGRTPGLFYFTITSEIALRMIKILYGGSHIYLDRKMKIAREIMENEYERKNHWKAYDVLIKSAVQE